MASTKKLQDYSRYRTIALIASGDNVACFVCNKNLDGWEADDIAWLEHVKHAPNCALVRLDVEANRGVTFAPEVWPHVGKASLTAEKMAQAGFFYWPRSTSHRAAGRDDTSICFQCGLALDGWEEEDNPRQEHAKRRPDCPFIKSGVAIRPCSFEFLLASQPDLNAVRHISAKTAPEKETSRSQTFQLPQLNIAKKRPFPAVLDSRKTLVAASVTDTPTEARTSGTIQSVKRDTLEPFNEGLVQNASEKDSGPAKAAPRTFRRTLLVRAPIQPQQVPKEDRLSGLQTVLDESHLDMTVEAVLQMFMEKRLAEYDLQSAALLEQLSVESVDRLASVS